MRPSLNITFLLITVRAIVVAVYLCQDQDGRLTTALSRALSPKFKQTPLVVTPGNHDIWVAGGPGSDSDRYDQFGHGFMQVCAGV